ncbi:MAG TPA: gamma-glutamylcyclotransferase [Pirellulaceae bacterium]|nr:gamma-glutamylcyclotransferase [Pirellulaceae bacterium]
MGARVERQRGWAIAGELVASDDVEGENRLSGPTARYPLIQSLTATVFNLKYMQRVVDVGWRIKSDQGEQAERGGCFSSSELMLRSRLSVDLNKTIASFRLDQGWVQQAGCQVQNLFCYGTLMRGECRFSALSRIGEFQVKPARAPGRLVHLGSYPGLLPATGTETVPGELFEFQLSPGDWDQALKTVDAIEGFTDHESSYNHYVRLLSEVQVEWSSHRQLAWVYVYVGSLKSAKPLPNNSWR